MLHLCFHQLFLSMVISKGLHTTQADRFEGALGGVKQGWKWGERRSEDRQLGGWLGLVAGLAGWLAWLGGWLGRCLPRSDLYIRTLGSLRSDDQISTLGHVRISTFGHKSTAQSRWMGRSLFYMYVYIYMCVCVENRIRMQTMRCGTVILHTTANTLSMSLAFPIKGPSPSQSQYRCIELRGHAPKAVALRFRRKISNACAAQSASAMREESSPIRPQVSILYQNAYNNHVKT